MDEGSGYCGSGGGMSFSYMECLCNKSNPDNLARTFVFACLIL